MNKITLDTAEIEKMEAAGIINHCKLRDVLIHQEYKQMREKGIQQVDCLKKLKETYFLSEDRLKSICCRKNNVEIKETK